MSLAERDAINSLPARGFSNGPRRAESSFHGLTPRTEVERHRALKRGALLLAVALAARIATFGNPIVHVDEQFYFIAAQGMLHGSLPYVDIWDRKPIGIFLIYLPAAAAGPMLGIWVYQAMALCSAVLTALTLATLSHRAGWCRGALPAAAMYIVWLNLADGQGGQSPVFYNLPMALAVLLASFRADAAISDCAGRTRGLAAMFLVGLALQIKYSAVFEGIWIGIWLSWMEWRSSRSISTLGHSTALVLAAVAPTLAVAGSYALLGHAGAFVFANFVSVLQRGADPVIESASNLFIVSAILSPLLALAIAGIRFRAGDAGQRMRQVFLQGWLASSVTGLLIFGSWFLHYALPVMVPAACCAASYLTFGSRRRALMLPLLLIVSAGAEVTVIAKRLGRGTPTEFAHLVEIVGRGTGSLYVYSGEPMLYAATGRPSVSRYVFPSHLSRIRETGAIGADQAQEIRRIFAHSPAIVVMRPPFRGERPELRALATTLLTEEAYRLKGRTKLGSGVVQVYEHP